VSGAFEQKNITFVVVEQLMVDVVNKEIELELGMIKLQR